MTEEGEEEDDDDDDDGEEEEDEDDDDHRDHDDVNKVSASSLEKRDQTRLDYTILYIVYMWDGGCAAKRKIRETKAEIRRRSNLYVGEAKAITRCITRTSTKDAGRPADMNVLDTYK